MQALQGAGEDSAGKLETIYPIIIGRPCPVGDPRYPCSGNFFTDGSADSIRDLAAVPSPPTMTAVTRFLQKHKVVVDEDALTVSVVATVRDLLALQGAQLWNHATLQEEDIPEDAELWEKACKEPPEPPLDLSQLRMIKAELRALVTDIHEVIDRAYAKATARQELRSSVEGRRRALLAKVVERMSSERLARSWTTWRELVGASERMFEAGLCSLGKTQEITGSTLNPLRDSLGDQEKNISRCEQPASVFKCSFLLGLLCSCYMLTLYNFSLLRCAASI